jgi:hypothetical protein
MKTFGVQAQSTGSSWMARLGLLYCSVTSLGLVSTAFAQPAEPAAAASTEEPATEEPATVPSAEQAAEATYDQPAEAPSYEGSSDTSYGGSSDSSYADSSDSGYAESESSQEESSFTVNAMMKMQGGLFVPLPSDGFKAHENEGFKKDQFGYDRSQPCDQVAYPNLGTNGCYPTDHGKKAGTPSLARATLQIEAHWDFSRKFALHTIIRGVRMAKVAADQYAQVPSPPDDITLRREYAENWVQANQYNRFELREFYLDALPLSWLTFRIGRQQVAWGETGQFRLLDVVNPIDSTWHFGPLESFEDQRVPLWMLLTTIDVPKLNAALEMLWIPGIDRKRDMVSPPLSNAGAWGVPFSNQPGTYRIRNKDFQYPGNKNLSDSRFGARWKGDLGDHGSYSFVYMYTHMQVPVLKEVDLTPTGMTSAGQALFSPDTADRATLGFPRQHIAGMSAEYVLDDPFGMTLRFEGAVEPNRSYSQRTDTGGDSLSKPGHIIYTPSKEVAISYALVVQRPTMIRFLNPVQNFLLVGQFMHTAVPTLDPIKDANAVQVVGYNDWLAQKHSFTLVAFATTTYWNGIFTPRLTGVWVVNPYYKDSGYYSIDLGFRIGPHYRVNVMATDFIGKNPYRDLGLFRDRDELHASVTVLF